MSLNVQAIVKFLFFNVFSCFTLKGNYIEQKRERNRVQTNQTYKIHVNTLLVRDID